MTIRDSHAKLNGDNTTFECPSGGLVILSDDGREMFRISLLHDEDATISVESGDYCTHNKKRFKDMFTISPRACNLFYVRKVEYKP